MIHQLLSPAKALRTLRKTHTILLDVLRDVTQQQAATLRDGADGWSVLFVVCHLRDYEVIYRERVDAMLAEDNPTFVVVSNEEWERRGAYAEQDMWAVVANLRARREGLIALLETLSDEQWRRPGLHPQQGPASVLEVAINVGLHDIDHLEQIVRCLAPLQNSSGLLSAPA
jgi:hypothetical protein